MGFFGPSITVRAYSITGFTLVLTGRVSVCNPILWAKVLQNPPVLPRPGHDRGPTRPAPPNRPGPTNPPRLINRGPIQTTRPNPANGAKPGQSIDQGPTPNQSTDPARSDNRDPSGLTNRGKTTRPNQPNRANKRPANGPTDQTQPNPRKPQTTPQTGRILK